MFNKFISPILCCIFLLTTSCGYIIYPERRGQKDHSDKIDVGIAVLDAVGLLFFIIPGVISFYIDFTSNTIYLPKDYNGNFDIRNMKEIFLGEEVSKAKVEMVIYEETNLEVDLNNARIEKYSM